ncbi:thioesterase II family protein [Nocardia paucivorans]|uniref:thioesterase II family protein n=1 Tax=Nocardia paucivorans TaxID=114259 RepID=UPI0002FFC8FE|nr:thioesterase domain-containing protein [Nocardia paucivorans]
MMPPTVRNDHRAVETYRYRGTGTLTCDIVTLPGRADPTTTPAQIQAWREHTSGSFDARYFPGRHFCLDEHPHEVADAVREKIGGAEWRAVPPLCRGRPPEPDQ